MEVIASACFIISIHAPHEGERRIQICSECGEEHISIHAPHEGERRHKSCSKYKD